METQSLSKSPDLKVRNMHFQFDPKKFPKYYHLDNCVLTHLMNAKHIIFPEGEKFFIRSIQRYLPEIRATKDQKLIRDVQNFIGQEGVHFREHEDFWDILDYQGLRPRPFARVMKYMLVDFSEMFLRTFFTKSYGDKLALAFTAALEHYTAITGAGELHGAERPFSQELPEEMQLLFLWHGAEELEHKAVAFDVAKATGVGMWERRLAFLFASGGLYIAQFAGMFYFLFADKEVTLKRFFKDLISAIKILNYKKKQIQEEVKNSNQELKGNMWLDFLDKDFHPNKHDNYHLALDFFQYHEKALQERLA